MAFQVTVVLTGLLVGWIRKGSVWDITNIRIRLLWLLPIAYLLQHISIAYLDGVYYELSIVLSYLALMVFCAVNIRTPGIAWGLAGTASNFLAMVVNGLRMPAYVPAVEHMAPSYVPALMSGHYGKSVAMSSKTHLNFLGDIFSFQIHPVSLLSIGDILFAIGFVILIQHAMRSGRSANNSETLTRTT
ncbi:hypothetical protein GCM10025857_26490 [Alicyclobacillus contaminans]|uniref:DUF5317 domain-containing protein n=1 Tax=Alicyclobacillus contaminans TaxID=392016 RepID=UPI0006853C9F|nr:DUF5317 domain-containing protein [Alicyclobacillus contaminans]GMA51292.1 hypothetical protein GCM10025857_26490 [Alicyclobacillus contaminans]